MLKILLACSAGMSTSLLEKSMREYAASNNQNCEINALPAEQAKEDISKYDVCLLGPQVKFLEAQFKQIAGKVPVIVIPPQIYAMAKGDECFKIAIENIKK